MLHCISNTQEIFLSSISIAPLLDPQVPKAPRTIAFGSRPRQENEGTLPAKMNHNCENSYDGTSGFPCNCTFILANPVFIVDQSREIGHGSINR